MPITSTQLPGHGTTIKCDSTVGALGDGALLFALLARADPR